MITHCTKDNSRALAAFMDRKTEIDTNLERLQDLSDDHFNASPDNINWEDVGTLGHYANQLRQITDSAFGEGECAND